MTESKNPGSINPQSVSAIKDGRDGLDRPLVRRFYKMAGVAEQGKEYLVQLDGKTLKTPLKKDLLLPSKPLAYAIAEEWNNQKDYIHPAEMLFTKFANTAIDRAQDLTEHGLAEIVKYAGSDLICYRADHPQELIQLQNEKWDPVLAFLQKTFGAEFRSTQGLVFMQQEPEALKSIETYFRGFDLFALSALHYLSILTGSPLLVWAYHAGFVTADEMWRLAHIDEDWQADHWGLDQEARLRREKRSKEMEAADQFLKFLQ